MLKYTIINVVQTQIQVLELWVSEQVPGNNLVAFFIFSGHRLYVIKNRDWLFWLLLGFQSLVCVDYLGNFLEFKLVRLNLISREGYLAHSLQKRQDILRLYVVLGQTNILKCSIEFKYLSNLLNSFSREGIV